MAVRNSAELGPILSKISFTLAGDQELCRLLKYTDPDPLDQEKHKDVDGFGLLNKNIYVIPEINASDFNTAAKIGLIFSEGSINGTNTDYKELALSVLVYTPFKSWAMNDTQLRPFAIIGRIESLLKNKRIESVGNIRYQGFEYFPIDDNISGYNMGFLIDVFN